MQKKGNRKASAGKQAKASTASQSAKTNEPKVSSVSSVDVLKQNLKNVNKGSLFNMLNEVKNTKPDDWKNPEAVKDMAKKFAEQLKLPVSEDRLNAFMNAFKDATKGAGNTGPDANVESLVKKYGKGVADDSLMNEMKKFVKPKE